MTRNVAADERAKTFDTHRKRLTGLAYRMLGSVAEAEDVVQDAYLRWHQADVDAVQSPESYLSTIVTRLSLDRLKQARHRRETYVGPWLPEPLPDDALESGIETVAYDASVALMLALERLSPLERAAFLLHDVFEQEFEAIASVLGRSAQACRQLASRARSNVKAATPRFTVHPGVGEEITRAFFAASRSGDVTALQQVLAEEVTLHTDGGGRKLAALRPILGRDKVCRFFLGLSRKADAQGPQWFAYHRLNGLPAVVTVERDGTLQTTALEIVNGRITALYVVRNPDKLRHIRALIPQELWDPPSTAG